MASRELVPGDVIRLRLGAIVPEDAHLPAGDPAEGDRSALTGAALPVTQRVGDAGVAGTIASAVQGFFERGMKRTR